MAFKVVARRPIETAESPLVAHGRRNLETGQGFSDAQGMHTILSGSVQDERLNQGKPTVIPFVYEGRQVEPGEAIERAIASGVQWPFAETEEQATHISKAASAAMDQYLPATGSRKFRVVGRRDITSGADLEPEWSDYGRQMLATFASMGAGLFWLGQKLGEKTGINFLERGSITLKEAGRNARDAWINESIEPLGITQEGLSENARHALEVEFLGDSSFGEKWQKAKLLAIGSLPATLGGLGAGGVLAKGLGAAGLPVAGAAAVGYGLGEAGVAAPMSGEAVEAEIQAKSFAELMQSPEYRAIYEALENVDPAVRADHAREILANAAAGDAAAMTLVSTFLLSAPAGAVLQKFLPGAVPVTTSRLASAGKGGATEAVQEFFQSGTEQLSQNVAMQSAGFDIGLLDNVLEEAVGGALSGAPLGGALGFAAPGGAPEPATVPEEPETAPPGGGPVPAETVLGEVEEGEAERVHRYQLMRNDYGSAPQIEVLPLTQERFLKYIRPYIAEGSPAWVATVEEYQQQHPEATHLSLQRSATDRPWKPGRVGPIEQLTQFKGQLGRTIRPVEAFDSAEAAEWAKQKASEVGKVAPGALDPAKDSLSVAISKLGGLNRQAAESEGLDPAEFDTLGYGIKRVFTQGGRTAEDLAEVLSEHGYPVVDETGTFSGAVLMERLREEMQGQTVETPVGAEARMEREAAEREGEEEGPDLETINRQLQELAYQPPPEYEQLTDGETRSLADLAMLAREYAGEDRVQDALMAGSDSQAARELWQLIRTEALPTEPTKEKPREETARAEPPSRGRPPAQEVPAAAAPPSAEAAPAAETLDEALLDRGEPIQNRVDAERRFGEDRIFAFHEQDETPTEVTSIKVLRSYTPDQLIALPREEPTSEQERPQPVETPREDRKAGTTSLPPAATRQEVERVAAETPATEQPLSAQAQVESFFGPTVAARAALDRLRQPKAEPETQPAAATQRSETEERLSQLLEGAIRRFAMEQQGQAILDDMVEAGISPQAVSADFWKDTYLALDAKTQLRFQKMLRGLGFQPGDVGSVAADGTENVLENWIEVGKFIGEDLAASADALEGTERGYVALMKWANDQRQALGSRTPPEKQTPKLKAPAEKAHEVLRAEKPALPKGPPVAVEKGLTVQFSGKTYSIGSIEEARDKWVEFRDRTGAGASDIGSLSVLNEKGQEVAKIAYNGRIFETEPTTNAEIDEVAHEAATSPENELPQPTQAQKEAGGEGNYKLGAPVKLYGVTWRVENPQGSYRYKFDEELLTDVANKAKSYIGAEQSDRILDLLRGGRIPEAFKAAEQFEKDLRESGGELARTRALADRLKKMLDSSWFNKMPAHYARALEVEGADGDKLDAFIGPVAEDQSRNVYIADMQKLDGKGFDESKVMLGFRSRGHAYQILKSSYEGGLIQKLLPGGAPNLVTMTADQFRQWVQSSATRQPAAKAAAPPVEKSKKSETPIEDFGEVLEGARKHVWEAYRDRLRAAGELDIATEPLSKSWPEPDYQKLIDEGTDPWVVAFVRTVRDEVPSKPRKGWKLQGWVEQTQMLRGVASQVLDGTITRERISEALGKPEFSRLRKAIEDRVDLYQAVRHAKSLKGVRISSGSYSMLNGEKIDPPKVIWTVERAAKATAFSNWPTQLAQGDTREEAIASFKRDYEKIDTQPNASKQVKFDIYSYRSGPKVGKWIVGKKVGKDHVDLREFDTAKEARVYRSEHIDELVVALERWKSIPEHRKESDAPRVGMDHRNGADITPEIFGETFAFRGVQFGNFVEGGRRQKDLNDAYDALLDLAGVLGIPAKALSLNGELGLAFGARGKGGKRAARAHYEPDTIVINLTKREGAGSLAHEWWHALDNYFSRRRGDKPGYVSEDVQFGRPPGAADIRPEVLGAFIALVRAINETSLKQRSRGLDRRRTKAYWSTGREMSARAFESYIVAKLQDQEASNDYLANIVSEDYWKAAAALGVGEGTEQQPDYPYPTAAEIPLIRAAFDQLFATIETRETEQGIEVREIDDTLDRYIAEPPVEGQAKAPRLEAAKAQAVDALADLRSTPSVLAQEFVRDLAAKQRTALVGKPVNEALDLAVLAQIYRDPRFETLRVLFTDEQNRIVAQIGLTSRLPASAVAILGTDTETYLGDLWRTAQEHGASGYWMLHNHPSGESDPSYSDQALTRKFASTLPGFRGHVVIDENNYSSIDAQGNTTRHEQDLSAISFKPTGGVAGQTIIGPNDLLAIARRIPEQATLASTVLVITDNRHRVMNVAEVPNSEVLGKKPAAVRRILLKRALMARGARLFAVGRNSKALHAVSQYTVDAIEIHDDGRYQSYAESGVSRVSDVFPDYRAPRLTRDTSEAFDYLQVDALAERQDVVAREETGEYKKKIDTVTEHITDPKNSEQLTRLRAQESDRRNRSFLRALKGGQPIDRAFRIPFRMFGTIDEKGIFHLSPKAKGFARKAVDEARALMASERFQWLRHIGGIAHRNLIQAYGIDDKWTRATEAAKHGLIDRYGLPKEYVTREFRRGADERALLLKGREVLTTLVDEGVGLQEAEVLYKMLTGQQIKEGEMGKLAAPIQLSIDQMGQEAVEVGLLSREDYERNRGTYLHRSYLAHEANKSPLAKMASDLLGMRRRRIIGNQFKGRGIFLKKSMDKVLARVPEEWWGRKKRKGKADIALLGQKFIVLDQVMAKGAGTLDIPGMDPTKVKERIIDRLYWPADLPLPNKWQGLENRGTFEVRDIVKGELVLWRDFTAEERARMGEIVDARYAIAKTYLQMAHDLSTGRLFKDIAENPDWASKTDPTGDSPSGHESRLHLQTGSPWVKVPDTLIPKSRTAKYGALAGMYVRSDIWKDLVEIRRMQNHGFWRGVMRQWKLNKTARNPVVHFNNIMSNVLLMDMIDVRFQDFYRGLVAFVKEDEHYQDALRHGAFGADIISQEIRQNILEPILRQIETEQETLARTGIWGVTMRLGTALRNAVIQFDYGMREGYRLEDEVFRMATYMRQIDLGYTPEEAALHARNQFLNYDIRAPWINALRETVLPFIAYTYRAVPVIATSIADRPWKLAKYATLAYLANTLGYLLGGDPDDEEEERATLREGERGRTWLGTYRMIRTPFRDRWANPIFLDTRRYIPAGDIFDMHQGSSALPIPAPFQFGGPLMIATELMLNRAAFTGEDIVDDLTDSPSEKAGKWADFLWKSYMPSAPWVPGSWYYRKIKGAAFGELDPMMREYSVPLAISSSLGLKLKPHDVELNRRYLMMHMDAIDRALHEQLRALATDLHRQRIDRDYYDERVTEIRKKQERLGEERQKLIPQ